MRPARYAARPTRWSLRRAVFISARVRMHERLLEHARFLEPVRGAPMQLRDRLGFAPSRLGAEHVAEEVVVPVPLSLPIERHQEQVLSLDRLEGTSGAGVP